MMELALQRMQCFDHGIVIVKPSPVLKAPGGSGSPPNRRTATTRALDDGRKPGESPRRAALIDQGKRLDGLAEMAMYQKQHPHSYMSDFDKAAWNIQWLWIIFVLLTARAIFMVVDDSDDPATQRGIVWDLIFYAKKQAASIHSCFPYDSAAVDENTTLTSTQLG